MVHHLHHLRYGICVNLCLASSAGVGGLISGSGFGLLSRTPSGGTAGGGGTEEASEPCRAGSATSTPEDEPVPVAAGVGSEIETSGLTDLKAQISGGLPD